MNMCVPTAQPHPRRPLTAQTPERQAGRPDTAERPAYFDPHRGLLTRLPVSLLQQRNGGMHSLALARLVLRPNPVFVDGSAVQAAKVRAVFSAPDP